MRFRSCMALLILGFLAGCGGQAQTRSVSTDVQVGSGGNQNTNDQGQPANATAGNDVPVPPQGALYTILCQTFTGPTRVEDAERMKQMLIARTNSHDWYCIHTDDESDLYYGYYQTFDDRTQLKEFTRAKTDQARIASLTDENGDRLFAQAIFQPISLPDPPAPKEWDLSNNHGFWTLQVATYRDNPQRKQVAIDCVKELRQQGWEAYYHHFPSSSDIFIGAWPRTAVKEQENTSAEVTDPSAHIYVFSNPIAGLDPTKLNGPAFMPKVEIVDPTLRDAMSKWPYTLVNGTPMQRRRVEGHNSSKPIPFPSILVQVPHSEDQVEGNQPINGDSGNPAQPIDPMALPRDPLIPMNGN